MQSSDIRRKYLDFFVKRGHAEIPSSPLVPENDPTTLFTSSGMQPLIPYLLGQPHPLGKRLVNSQKSFRAQDIDEVGDNRHTTFFEMLGNWSLGDYFKKEQLPWNFEFLTKVLGLDPKRLYVSVFEGDGSVPKDTESVVIWKEIFAGVGIDVKEGTRIFAYPAKNNWWSRSGEPEKMPPHEPGGPDSEVFYDFGEQLALHEKSPYKTKKCHINCDCGRFLEIANSVFMQYQKQENGSLKELGQKNVDFGGGLERMTAAANQTQDIFETDMFLPVIRLLESLSGKAYKGKHEDSKSMRILADHIRGSVMMMAEGVAPSNKQQGYILRRLIRRSLLYGRTLGLHDDWTYIGKLVDPIVSVYEDAYPYVRKKENEVKSALVDEAMRFGRTLEKGLREIEKIQALDGTVAFKLYETYGFPWEMTEEIALSKGQKVNRKEFEEQFNKHRELSRTAASGMFKGGLADHSEKTTRLHTATHMLHAALRSVLGEHVEQKGSNITVERLRFDFSHPAKVTPEEINKIEALINKGIGDNLPVTEAVMEKDEAVKSGAMAFFGERYGGKVKVYTVGESSKGTVFSREICGGPHVSFTGQVGHLTIKKEESAGAGIRRIYAVISDYEPTDNTQKLHTKKR